MYMYITLQINFQKPDRASVTKEQPPAGLIKPEPYRAIIAKAHLFSKN